MHRPLLPSLLAVLILGVLVLGGAQDAIAQENLDAKREEARPIALEGLELFQAGKHNEAIAKLEEAERIFHAPTHLLFIGRARRALGEHLTAYDTFVDILIEDIPNYAPPPFLKAQADAKEEAESIRSEIATVVIAVTGMPMDRVTVTIDDKPVPPKRLAFPVGITAGTHAVAATADGAEKVSESVEGVIGQSAEVNLTLVPTVAPTPDEVAPEESSFPVLATIALALGGGALVAGAVTGVMTLSKASDIKDSCDGSQCPASEENAADDAKLLGNVSTAMFVVGGVLAATGIVLLIVDPFNDPPPSEDEETSASLGIRLGPTGAALVGTF